MLLRNILCGEAAAQVRRIKLKTVSGPLLLGHRDTVSAHVFQVPKWSLPFFVEWVPFVYL